jgi:hypothetical protein
MWVLSLHRLTTLGDGDDMEYEEARSETTAERRWPAVVEMRRGGGDWSAEDGFGAKGPRKTSMSFLLTKPLYRLLHVLVHEHVRDKACNQHRIQNPPPCGCHSGLIGDSIQIYYWPKTSTAPSRVGYRSSLFPSASQILSRAIERNPLQLEPDLLQQGNAHKS